MLKALNDPGIDAYFSPHLSITTRARTDANLVDCVANLLAELLLTGDDEVGMVPVNEDGEYEPEQARRALLMDPVQRPYRAAFTARCGELGLLVQEVMTADELPGPEECVLLSVVPAGLG